jgi:hypothetical protein
MAIAIGRRWNMRRTDGEAQQYIVTDPDGNEHGPMEWEAAWTLHNTENAAIEALERKQIEADLLEMLQAMNERGVTRIATEYSGSGDEGDFDGLTVEGASATAAEREALEGYFERLLWERYSGWENNEGGFGEFTIDLTAETIEVDHTHNTYVEDYETEQQKHALTTAET